MRYIGDPFEVGFTRAGALLARPCHFRVKRQTDWGARGSIELIWGLRKIV
jgi:hypothetical protein